ncbi:MAG: PAAR domain-containing protein [Rhizobiaceae bacterium]|nr:PAAR domain-containing protein [Rhizobiaceae bacterium]MCV0408027.1 PAAR domain-containing protein [Rhizobiaceae bacterium]
MPPAARISDMHTCPLVSPGPVPHVGGPIITGSPNVLTGYMPQARVTDKCICTGPTDVIVKGSPTVLVNNLMASRIGDMTVHGGVIVTGQFNVLIGDAAVVSPPPAGAPCLKSAAAAGAAFVRG